MSNTNMTEREGVARTCSAELVTSGLGTVARLTFNYPHGLTEVVLDVSVECAQALQAQLADLGRPLPSHIPSR